jgi:hypothetical protein
MDEPTLDALLQRLTRIEQANRRWKRLGGAAFALLGLVVILGASGTMDAGEIRAKRFILVDGGGNRRAVLGIETKEENPKAAGSAALLFYKGNDPRLELRVTAEGGPGVTRSGKDGLTILSTASLMMFGQDLAANEMIFSQWVSPVTAKLR